MASGSGTYIKQKHEKSKWSDPTPMCFLSNNENLLGPEADPTADPSSAWHSRMYFYRVKRCTSDVWDPAMRHSDPHPKAWFHILVEYGHLMES